MSERRQETIGEAADGVTPEAASSPEAAPVGAERGGAADPESYEAAVERLEAIIAALDTGKAGLRETLALVREGKALVTYCKGELDAVSGELEELDLDALVAQLEAAAGE